MVKTAMLLLCAGLVPAAFSLDTERARGDVHDFTSDFGIENLSFSTRGANPYFNLKPGRQMVYQGLEGNEEVQVVITITQSTMNIGGIETRVVEEREKVDGELVEVSRNYMAYCDQNASIFYFGEDVDNYENGMIVNHDGSWRAFRHGARPGVLMPGLPLLGARYYQELAPEAADRAEILSMNEVVTTPLATYRDVLHAVETSPLEPGSKSHKWYAPGLGLIQDGPVRLVEIR